MCIINTNSSQNNNDEECKPNILLSETRYSLDSYCKIMDAAQTLRFNSGSSVILHRGSNPVPFDNATYFSFIYLWFITRHFQ